GARDAFEPGSNLLGAVALHLPEGDRLEGRIAEPVQEALAHLGDQGGEFRRRLAADDVFQRRQIGRDFMPQPAAAFLAALVLLEVECLAGGDDDQELPEVFAVGELRELAALSPLTEAVEGAQGNVLLVRGAARQPLELISSQTHELLEVALPE